MPPVFAARIRIVLPVVLAGLALTGAVAAAPAQVTQPTITLLSPGNGTVAEGAQGRTAAVTFRWQAAWFSRRAEPSRSPTAWRTIRA